MSVDLESWATTILKYPLKFKFDGLNGYFTDVREACVHDDHFMDQWMYKEAEGIEEDILAHLEYYIDYLINKVDLRTCHDSLLRMCRDPEYTEHEMKLLEDEVGEHRFEFASDTVDPQLSWDSIRDDDPSYYLEKHPPEKVYNAAYGCGFPIENVVYVCPSCNAQAMTLDELKDNGWQHYCSLCGSEYLEAHDFRNPQDFEGFLKTLEVTPFPFREGCHALKEGDKVYWMNPDEGQCSTHEVVVSVDPPNGAVLLESGSRAQGVDLVPLAEMTDD